MLSIAAALNAANDAAANARKKAEQGTDISACALSGCCFHEQLTLRVNIRNYSMGVRKCQWISVQQKVIKKVVRTPQLELFKFVFGIVRGGCNTNTIFHAPGRKSALRCCFPDRALPIQIFLRYNMPQTKCSALWSWDAAWIQTIRFRFSHS